MTAAAPSRSSRERWTIERAAALDPDTSPGEIESGEFVSVSRNSWRHGEIMLTIGILLRAFARANPGWRVAVGDPGAKLKRSPDILRGPDVGVIREGRVPTGKGADGWLEGAPDLAVEITGDSQTATGLLQKALEYLRAGAQRVWIVDTDAERLLVLSPPDHIQILGPTDILDGGDVLPGFRCEVSELFRT